MIYCLGTSTRCYPKQTGIVWLLGNYNSYKDICFTNYLGTSISTFDIFTLDKKFEKKFSKRYGIVLVPHWGASRGVYFFLFGGEGFFVLLFFSISSYFFFEPCFLSISLSLSLFHLSALLLDWIWDKLSICLYLTSIKCALDQYCIRSHSRICSLTWLKKGFLI